MQSQILLENPWPFPNRVKLENGIKIEKSLPE